jgi:hypothetical protein
MSHQVFVEDLTTLQPNEFCISHFLLLSSKNVVLEPNHDISKAHSRHLEIKLGV